ncbi:hypothetical protein BGZ99_005086 [Dissophora globulifera]|uniref:Uncharacterized protein n=1 Tax=Dissophora globulifera TaxID=979702 RepID=A0A9P6RG91_9FUNG|nr:hypothetical protein BGZ99_005086 [Dissophora globulifera]
MASAFRLSPQAHFNFRRAFTTTSPPAVLAAAMHSVSSRASAIAEPSSVSVQLEVELELELKAEVKAQARARKLQPWSQMRSYSTSTASAKPKGPKLQGTLSGTATGTATVKAAATTANANPEASSNANPEASSNAKADEDTNPLMLLLKGHKNQRLAIATVFLAALMGDMTFAYFTLFHGRKEGEVIKTDTVYDKIAQKIAPYLINEEGISPIEK